MFQSLPQFYNSAEWRKFRLWLIAERTNKTDGIVYCEYSGLPILQSYDIVLHHKTPLTMGNVNDYAVSLNPDNIMIVNQRSHNEIHARFGYMAQRKVYIVWGAPCSGKTTFVRNVKGNSDLVVDVDAIWACINGGDMYAKPNALKTNMFLVRDTLYDSIKTRAGKWERAWVIAGLPTITERERLAEMLGGELIHIDTDRDECIKRLSGARDRTEMQKTEWAKYIDKWFDDYQSA